MVRKGTLSRVFDAVVQKMATLRHFSCDGEWEKFSPQQSKEDFYKEMTEGLPRGTKIEMTLNKGRLGDFSYRYARGKKHFAFSRVFADKSVYHNSAKVSLALQSQHIARTVNRNLFRLYARLGIEEAVIAANEIGVYAWARIGFVPDKNAWLGPLRKKIGERLDYLERNPSRKTGPLPKKYIATLRKALKSEDPKMFWFIVDQQLEYYGMPMGKLLTLPNPLFSGKDLSYNGTFKMKDPESVNRFNAYVKQEVLPCKKTPKPKT